MRAGRKEGTIGVGASGDDNQGVGSMGGKLLNGKGQWEVDGLAWGVLDLVWPKPGELIFLFSERGSRDWFGNPTDTDAGCRYGA